MKLRIGISPCPNDVFIFSGLLLGQVKPGWDGEYAFEDVETLNQKSGRAVFDLVKISYAHALNCPDHRLLPCGGALGRGCGPLLLTGGAEWNPEAEIRVPGEHTTANFLLDFWAQRPLRKRFQAFDALYRALRAEPAAQGVVIHEMRFTYAGDGLRLTQDLGSHWEQNTGHPIPLGVLAYRERPGLPSVAAMEEAVRASLDWAWAHETEALELCARHAQSLEAGVIRAHVALYVNDFTRNLGDTGTAAVERFFSLLRRFRAG